jgi:predicted nucleic acid-binding protein
MSSKYVIDSSAWLEYHQGSARAVKIKPIIESEEIATSIISVAELSDKFARENENFEPFLLFIQSRSAVLPVTISIAAHSGKLKRKMREKVKEFGLADAIILQTALENKAKLITCDSDFEGSPDAMLI